MELQNISIAYRIGNRGVLYLCRSKEAQEHFDNAEDAIWDAIKHSLNAGASIIIPPLAFMEGWEAVESWMEMAHEYCEGIRCEERERQEASNE